MGRESRHYRKRSSSRGRSGSRSKSRSPDKRSKKEDRERGRRERSRSRERRRSRSRDRKRPRRSRSRDRRRSRSRERKSRGKRSRSGSKSRKTDEKSRSREKDSLDSLLEKKKVKEEKEDDKVVDQDFDQNKLEEEMRKRKERVEKWREEQRKKAIENIGEIKKELEEMKQGKKWSLEDDDDDDDDNSPPMEADDEEEGEGKETKDKEAKEESTEGEDQDKDTAMELEAEDDDVDPLDAYMEEVKQEVKKFNMGGLNDKPKGAMMVTKVVTVVKTKKGPNVHKKKGELMENDQDAMEYSSEEEEVDLQTALTGFQTKQRKVLEPVDHGKIEYESYRKNFYVEVPELAKMSPEEVIAYRAELEGITVKGKGCPKPIRTWVQCGVSMKILNSLKKHNYEKPTPIQAQAIPAIMSGRDLIGIAKTGSGKTIAFLLPMFRHIMDQRPLEESEGPSLALQITKECKKFSKPLGLRVVCVYGGTGISEQIAELKRGAEIIVCTPGRMIDMLGANSGRVTNLRRVTYVVLDEADRMFDMGFEPQTDVMFSATFPRAMEALARRILSKPIEVQVGGRSVVCSDVEQHVLVIEEEKKFLKLLEILGHYQEKGSVIIFVDKQEHADGLLKDLMKASYPCLSLHGGKSIKSSSGFSGKGFKFDETEHALANERKKLQKAALGLQDSDDEDGALDIEEQIESMFNSKKRVKDLAAPGAALPGAGVVPTTAASTGGTGGAGGPTSAGNIQKLEMAKRLALKINAQKNLGAEAQDVMQQATNAILRGGTIQLAEKINAKLNYTPVEKMEEEKQGAEQTETVKRYEEELEINDFPQTARWKVTSKEALQRIGEYSEAAITIRGTYFPPGKEPKEGERKIYLAIESANELAVQKAKTEITRLIKEELIRLQNSYQPTSKGRYKVL
ncbi:hypothetical protein WMY93_007530 [Mugilogobius chulae]|uniref:Probable ATP-dependent RNA helicase DDX46 n=1 Tax=Mugilogobius chulae TaxID=88201 RepID=A0AAW0PNX3_9GOBI